MPDPVSKLDAPGTEASWREPTDDEIEEAAGWIVSGDLSGRFGHGLTEMFVVDDGRQLPEAKLQVLYAYWQELFAKHDGRPSREHVDVLAILPAAGNVLLLDSLRDGFDARYRVYGSGIANYAGRDWTGATVSEMNAVTRTSLSLMYRACYRAVYRARFALFTQHVSPSWLSARSWRRLILPLFAGDGACSGFLVGNIPVDVRPLDDTQQALQKSILGGTAKA
ncbi:PAS domain-containing protein [Thalassobaculum fulvum]|uniref:PAS domain-containing protein n=1 Tax=Thalassobaculum fulvum TaxID=1633335 RepID=UPI00167B01E2|nr:PAS domain-containing protein [Thalassobaculum fulvum]